MGKIIQLNAPDSVKNEPLRVYVIGGGYEYIKMLFDFGFKGAKGIGDASFILFTGGEDVSPELYGEKSLPKTHSNLFRDKREKIIFEEALAAKIPMVGICRGGQFLNVMNTGKMWQHVDGHCGNHQMTILDSQTPRKIEVTSTHHQMMIPNPETAVILAAAGEAKTKLAFGTEVAVGKPTDDSDAEVIWYANTNCLCFQPHPEFVKAPKECREYFKECLDNYIIPYCQGK